MKRWLISLSFAALFASLASAAFALPTVNDVQAQVKKGNFTEAQSMMREVVEARPTSAKAHYLYAEILAHNARFADAAEQARMAKEIDPTLKFTDPDKFRSFEGLLDREQQRTATRSASPAPSTEQPRPSVSPVTAAPAVAPAEAPVQRSGDIPVWVWIGVAAVAFFAWRMMRTRAAPVMGSAGASYGPPVATPTYNNPGYAPNAGFGGGGMMQPGRGGSGMLGTGLAAAGGVAAGMMAEKWLEGRDHGANPGNAAFDNGEGNSFAPQRDDAAQALENRDVDFGTGNDWGGDAGASDAGSFDTGGSGGGDDSW